MNLQAHLEPLAAAFGDRREAPRRKLRFGADLAGASAGAVVRDLSTGGLRFETSVVLERGEAIDVVLPQRGSTRAVVVWRDGRSYGGEFIEPLSPAALSAALLRSDPVSAGQVAAGSASASGGARTAPSPARAAPSIIGWKAVAGGAALAGISYLLLPLGAFAAVAAVAILAGLLVPWGYWILDNILEL